MQNPFSRFIGKRNYSSIDYLDQSSSGSSASSSLVATGQAEEHILRSAVDRLVEGVSPKSKTARRQMGLFFRALNKKLHSTRPERDVQTNRGVVRGQETDIQGVFKHAGSDRYSIAVAPDFAVERTRAEVETHVALGSYLKHRYGDVSIGEHEVVAPADLQPGASRSGRRTRVRASAQERVPSTPSSTASDALPADGLHSWPLPGFGADRQACDIGDPAQGQQASTKHAQSSLRDLATLDATSSVSDAPVAESAPPLSASPRAAAPAVAAAGSPDSVRRAQAVSELANVLSKNAVEKASRILEIEAQFSGLPTSGPYRDELNRLIPGSGECLRLLQFLRCTPALAGNRGMGDDRIAGALRELQNGLRSADSFGTSGTGGGTHAPNVPSDPANRSVDTIRTEVLDALGQANGNFAHCAWVQRHDIFSVENGRADATPGADEGNNCLLVSILQHATGNYADRFHADMTKTLREAMVAKFPSIQHSDPLYDDTEAIEWVRNTVNAVYGRDLQLVSVMMTSDANGQGISPLMSGSSNGGTEPVLIWAKGTHYEALVAKVDAPPAAVPTHLEELEQVTGAMQKRLHDTLLAPDANGIAALAHELVEKLNRCLHDEMLEVQQLMQAASLPSERYSLRLIGENELNTHTHPGQSRHAVRRVLNQAGEQHPSLVSRKNAKQLGDQFLEKVECYKLFLPQELHSLITVDEAFRDAQRPSRSWASLVA